MEGQKTIFDFVKNGNGIQIGAARNGDVIYIPTNTNSCLLPEGAIIGVVANADNNHLSNPLGIIPQALCGMCNVQQICTAINPPKSHK